MDLTLKPITGLTFQLSAGFVHSRLYGVANTAGLYRDTRDGDRAGTGTSAASCATRCRCSRAPAFWACKPGSMPARFNNSPTTIRGHRPSVCDRDLRVDYADAADT